MRDANWKGTPVERMLRSCRGEPVDRPPVWLMRQAGRYLPEYRKVREGVSFMDMCKDVDRAVEVSLQPLDLLGTEAVIFFSDIFTPIPGMDVEIDFAPGPIVADPIRTAAQVEALRQPDLQSAVPFVFEILKTLRSEIDSRSIPLLGFAGAPFTLAAYLVEGQGSKNFSFLKNMMICEPEIMRLLLDKLTEMTVSYLNAQIDAGAQVVQLFDTWAGILGRDDYREWVLPYHKKIASQLNREQAPLILYVNNAAHVMEEIFSVESDVVSLDWRMNIDEAVRCAKGRVSLQGNLDPCSLAATPECIREMVQSIAAEAEPARGHVLNLGHGCLPETPVEGVRAFIEAAKGL